VLDTNVLVSALFARQGVIAEILSQWRSGHFTMVTSEVILQELESVLQRPKILRTFGGPTPSELRKYLFVLRANADIVTPVGHLDPIPGITPDDLMVLATTVIGKANILVTGDAALLSLKIIREIPIVTPRAFIKSLISSQS
jgi:putative PIN family toxin of toxin-antitoxin system